MKKQIIWALALGGFAASAQAADLSIDSLKDPLPDTLSYAGVTVYGTIDVGFGYTSNGNPSSGAFYPGMNYNLYANSLSQGGQAALTNNALSQSTIGVKIEENLGGGFAGIGKLDTGFNPISGQLADACESLIEAGPPRASNVLHGTNLPIPSEADGSRCGQAFNGQAYAGISNAAYGTLTFGRQNSLVLDGTATYDPMALSYSMSLIGYSGGPGGGVGSTETARWDNSVKYVYQYGPAHIAAMYASGSTSDTAIHGYGAAGNIGVTYKGFSIDGYYTKENGAVNSLLGALPGLTPGTYASNSLYYYLSDNEAYSLMGKYTFDLGGGFKDEGPSSKLTFFGGYQHTDMTNYTGAAGGTTIGGYELAWDNNTLTSTKTIETVWAGAKYETGPWSVAAAYYWYHQNGFSETNILFSSLGLGQTLSGGCTVNAGACAGDLNQLSLLLDYTFNKHFDVYAGISYQDVSGGLAHSFFTNDAFGADSNTTVVSGVRLKF